MTTWLLELPRVPPSLNRLGTRGSRHAVSRAKRELQEELVWALLHEGVPKPLTHVTASASLRFPTKKRRDPGNWSWLLEKCLGDALAPHDPEHPHRWLPDDTAEFFAFLSPVTLEPEVGEPRTRIALECPAKGSLKRSSPQFSALFAANRLAQDCGEPRGSGSMTSPTT